MNTRILHGFCALFPGTAMVAAHYFPWRKLLGRKLHRPEAYAIGTAAITGTATAAILAGDSSKHDSASYVVTSAFSAGAATLISWALDHYLGMYYSSREKDLAQERADECRTS